MPGQLGSSGSHRPRQRLHGANSGLGAEKRLLFLLGVLMGRAALVRT